MVEVLNAIAAQIYKVEDQNKWGYHLGDVWDTNSEEVVQFTTEVSTKFRKNRNKSYGQIDVSKGAATFSKQLSSFLKDDGAILFSEFVKEYTSKILIDKAKKKKNKEGSIIAFVHYNEEVNEVIHERVLILMITNTKALKFDDKETLTLTAQEVIDLDKFVQGARVEVKEFKDRHINNNLDEDINEVSFIRGTGDIRQYFTESLGTLNLLSDKKSSETATDALQKYFDQKLPIERGMKKAAEEKLGRFYENNNKDRKVSVEDIQRVINGVISEKYPLLDNTFVSFVDENEYKINDFFVQSKEQNELLWVEIKTDSFKASISKNEIGPSGSNKDITFNSTLNILTITQNITDDTLIKKLKSLINNG
ncbi:hypothetical protein I6F66_01785 [Pseudoalteromonas sp. NZS100_1]|uniref:hypothetical protein n=1 Tax=Pseudoalteromonas sp. NZS100_1 TaxID=2792073 RepID=UPI0018CF218E|nr:hypothetical protein [Pseudoalteromonas sp. NZS100_1]MBH0010810.1 hypothetical protein [Pseudoalteromonas sp. NZS100_1]